MGRMKGEGFINKCKKEGWRLLLGGRAPDSHNVILKLLPFLLLSSVGERGARDR